MSERRSVSLGLLKKDASYLVEKFYDEVGNYYFYKLIGGGIEEGEEPETALRREFFEELKLEIGKAEKIAVIKDSFVYKGLKRKIKAHIFKAEFKEKDSYNFRQKFIYSPEGIFLSVAMWKTLKEIAEEKLELYPRGIIEKIKYSGLC